MLKTGDVLPSSCIIQYVKEALQWLDSIKTHASNFDCDIHGGIDDPIAIDRELFSGPSNYYHLTSRAVSIAATSALPTDQSLNIYHPFPFRIYWPT